MTDKERLVALLTDFGVTFVEEPAHEWWPGQQANPPYPRPESPKLEPDQIVIPADKNEGYTGFVCVFSFEADGRFRSVGVWE